MTYFENPYKLKGNVKAKLRPSFGQASANLRPVRNFEEGH